jgi:hypothetical protein
MTLKQAFDIFTRNMLIASITFAAIFFAVDPFFPKS